MKFGLSCYESMADPRHYLSSGAKGAYFLPALRDSRFLGDFGSLFRNSGGTILVWGFCKEDYCDRESNEV